MREKINNKAANVSGRRMRQLYPTARQTETVFHHNESKLNKWESITTIDRVVFVGAIYKKRRHGCTA